MELFLRNLSEVDAGMGGGGITGPLPSQLGCHFGQAPYLHPEFGKLPCLLPHAQSSCPIYHPVLHVPVCLSVVLSGSEHLGVGLCLSYFSVVSLAVSLWSGTWQVLPKNV